MAAGCLLLDVCNKAVLNKTDLTPCDTCGGEGDSVWQVDARGTNRKRCMANLVCDFSAVAVITLVLSLPSESHRRQKCVRRV